MVGTPIPARTALVAMGAALVIGMAWLAALADAHAPGGSPALTALDLAVGFAFVIAAVVSRGVLLERLLVAAVGLAWLAGSVLAQARSAHQGLLALALLAFPAGQLRGVPRWLLAAAAVAVSLGVVPQLGVAGLFAVIAGFALTDRKAAPAATAYLVSAGAAIAAVLVFSWWNVQHLSAVSPLVLYGGTLFAVALAFPVAIRAVARSPAHLADQVLGDARFAGLAGLRVVLAGVLTDPNLDIQLWDTGRGVYLDSSGKALPATSSVDGLSVVDGDRPVARVSTTSRAIADPPTAEAVAETVRLTVKNSRLRDEQSRLAADLEASRRRLLAATDRERGRVAARLRTEAGASLEAAQSTLATATLAGNAEQSAVLEFASVQIAAAASEVQQIVAGIPPDTLGAGRLREALESLASHTPIQIRCDLAEDAAASAEVEQTLYYVCTEALANAAKHAAATTVVIHLRRAGDRIVLSVRDDGLGGADMTGFGLQGLAERLAAAGGEFTLSSPPGQGTVVTASVPAVAA